MTQLAHIGASTAGLDPAEGESWTEYLRGRISMDWRPGEFDSQTLLYIPDPDLDGNLISVCARTGCGIRVTVGMCPSCRVSRRKAQTELGDAFDLELWLKIPRSRRAARADCMVSKCERTPVAVGLCQTHRVALTAWRKETGRRSVDEWLEAKRPRPLPPAERKCRALICGSDAHLRSGLCITHESRWRAWQVRQGTLDPDLLAVDYWLNNDFELPLSADQESSYAEMWATPFHLLQPPIRWEYLFAVQQRDLELQAQMTPIFIRRGYFALRKAENKSLVGLDGLGLPPGARDVAGFFRDLQVRIDEAHRQWRGADGREPGVYFLVDLDLTPSSHRVSRTAKVDLSDLRTGWWATTVDSFLLEGGPHGRTMVSAVATVAPVIDAVLEQRGTPPEALGRSDVDAIARAIRKRWSSNGSQRSHFRAFKQVINHARLSDDFMPVWKRIPAAFRLDSARHRAAGTPDRGRANDDSFRFIPQPIVDWVMDHLYLIERNTALKTLEAQMMIYIHERCGRRTTETVRLRDNCLSYDSAGQAYLDWDRAKPPYGPGIRLPIHQDVHDAIRDWQAIKAEHGIESQWLFPSERTRADRPISGEFLRTRIEELMAAVIEHAPYESEVEGADGNLVYFDLRSIDAYAFRHAFAQRHADATDQHGRQSFSPEELQEWMGHANFNTTMGYFKITSRRKRRVMAALPSRRLNFMGRPVPVDRERDAFTKLAVSLGSCTEPANVTSGGNACALDHVCESCPFFLVDPFERDGLAAKRTYLQGRIERLRIIAPDSHMIQHYRLRIADCDRIIAGIDTYIEGLPETERANIRSALDAMSDVRHRASAPRRIDLRQILRDAK